MKHQPLNPIGIEAVQVAVLRHVHMVVTQSTRQLVDASGMSSSPIIRVLKANKFNLYEIKLVQEPNHPDSRLQFFELISQRLTEESHLLF